MSKKNKTYDLGFDTKVSKKDNQGFGEYDDSFAVELSRSLTEDQKMEIRRWVLNRFPASPEYESRLNAMEINTKLQVSQPDDASEVHADKVADAFVEGNAGAAQSELSKPVTESGVSGMSDGIEVPEGFESQLHSANSGGETLDENLRGELEQTMAADLSGVKIHNDPESHQLAEDINARAFETGGHIHFGEGEYDPHSDEGRRLIGHEVAHVVQDKGPAELNSKSSKTKTDIKLQPAKYKLSDSLQSIWFKGITELEAAFDGISSFSIGAKGFYVKRVQEAMLELQRVLSWKDETGTKFLIDLGPTGADGNFGNNTFRSLKSVQQKLSLVADGVVGKNTMRKLDELFWQKKSVPSSSAVTQAGDTATSNKTEVAVGAEKFSNDELQKHLLLLIAALKAKDKKETIYEMADVAYQLKLMYNEANDAHPTVKSAQILAAKILIAPFRLLAEAWIPKDKSQIGWYDLMAIWFFELGENPLVFDDVNAVTISELRVHEGVNKVRDEANHLIMMANKMGESEYSATFKGKWDYQLKHMDKNIQQIKTLDPGKVDSLELFMGTYSVSVIVDKKKGEAVKLNFLIENESHMESATRFRREQVKGNGQEGIISDLPRGQGVCLGGNMIEIFKWQE